MKQGHEIKRHTDWKERNLKITILRPIEVSVCKKAQDIIICSDHLEILFKIAAYILNIGIFYGAVEINF